MSVECGRGPSSELVSKRLYQLEVKLDAVLSWIKNEYGDKHTIFQTIRASLVGNINVRRGCPRVPPPPSDDLARNPVVVICKADQLRCRKARTRRVIRSTDSDKDKIELSQSQSGSRNSSLPEPSECEIPPTAEELDLDIVLDEIKTETRDEGENLPYYEVEEAQDQENFDPNSKKSVETDSDFKYDSKTSWLASNPNLKHNSLDETQVQVNHQPPGTTATFKRTHLAVGQDTVEVVKEESNKCSICGKLFLNRHTLKTHIETVHVKRKSFECSQCGKLFPRKGSLKVHQTSNLKPCFRKQKQVTITKSITRTRTTPSKHEPTQFPCEICAKVYNSRASLRSHHKIIHLGLKPYMCSVCGKCFGRSTDLKDHLDLHSDARNYKCSYCDKVFRLRRTMEQHRGRHLGVSKKQCTLCGKILVSAAGLRDHYHIQVVHEGVRRYPCSICDKKFTTWSARNYHEKTHSNPNTKYRGLNKVGGARTRKNDRAGIHLIRQVEADEIKKADKGGSHYAVPVINVSIPQSKDNDQKC